MASLLSGIHRLAWVEVWCLMLIMCRGQEVDNTASITKRATAEAQAQGEGESSSASPSPSPSGDDGDGGTSLSPLDSNATTTASRFLKHGGTYGGRVATRVIELADASVAVLITADNWSKWALVEPRLLMECGRLVQNEEREDGGLPTIVKPGFSEMLLFEKNPGIGGVCGVLSYTVEVALDEEPDYIHIMFSVPYNLNTYGAYFAVGVSRDYMNNSDAFDDLYYYTGEFRREKAGSMVQFSSERVLVRGTLTPDTYKPILSLVVLPIDKEDQFVPGEYYSPRIRAGAEKTTTNLLLLLLTLLPAGQAIFLQ